MNAQFCDNDNNGWWMLVFMQLCEVCGAVVGSGCDLNVVVTEDGITVEQKLVLSAASLGDILFQWWNNKWTSCVHCLGA